MTHVYSLGDIQRIAGNVANGGYSFEQHVIDQVMLGKSTSCGIIPAGLIGRRAFGGIDAGAYL